MQNNTEDILQTQVLYERQLILKRPDHSDRTKFTAIYIWSTDSCLSCVIDLN